MEIKQLDEVQYYMADEDGVIIRIGTVKSLKEYICRWKKKRGDEKINA